MRHGHALRTMSGESRCGDRVLVLEQDTGLFCAVIDGLGHGPQAAEASEAAARFLADQRDLPLVHILHACDRAIAHTRGAAITVLRIGSSAPAVLEHVAVGNVEVSALAQEPVHPVARGGVVGRRFRKAMPASYRLHPGDLLAVYTDGVSARFRLDQLRGLPPEMIARRIVKDYGRAHDDASCLVIEM